MKKKTKNLDLYEEILKDSYEELCFDLIRRGDCFGESYEGYMLNIRRGYFGNSYEDFYCS